MDVETEVKPWISLEEWKKVKNCLMQRKLKLAQEYINVWKIRTHKLDAGIETTHCLLSSILLNTNVNAHTLALSASVNRFLNLISHAGMNMFNLSKYYDVARHLAIPRWIVDVRHDTSHGQLPSYEVLKAAVAFCFNWIIVNYWQFEDHTIESLADVTNYANYPFIHELLDCYKYLKIYSIWGSRNLKDIKDQTEIYQQLSSFITNLKKSGNKNGEPPKKKKKIQTGSEDLNIPDCAVYLRNQVDKIIRQKDTFEIQAILTTLCSDQLLIPDEDMIHSLTEGKDDNSILPRNLIKIWSDILSMISQAGYLPDLLEKLTNTEFEDSFSKRVSEAWVSRILAQVSKKTTEKSNSGMLKFTPEDQNQDKWNEFVSDYILKCNNPNSVSKNLNWLSNIREPAMTSQQINRIKKLLDIFHLEENLDEESEEVSIKSVDDILDDKNSLTDSPTNGSIWTKVQDDLENVFGESDLKIGDLVNDKEGDSPKWLDEVDDDIVSLDWHHLMQKFKKTYY